MERDDTKFYGMKWVLWYKKDAKTIKRSRSNSATGKLINCSLVLFFLEQLMYSLIDFFKTCFVGIHRVLSTESKHDFGNTTKCFEESHEG
jgi:hypothetical protein